jgi:ATP-dependent helicase/nuclease subunit A
VRYVNRVAGGLLRAVSGGGYSVEDELVLSKPEPRGEEPVHTHIFELPTKKTEADLPEGEDPADRECRFVAEEIARLLREGRKNDGSPIRPSDITLLFRTAGRMPQFAAALSGVAPVVVSAERDFFLNPEVLLALSLLYVIDNPRRDVYLAAALRSPVFDFTLGDLCAVRAHGKALPTLYDALISYCEKTPGFEKGKRFLSQLSDWRRLAEGEAVGALVLRVLGDAGLFSLVGEGTTPHHDNLYRLYQYARSFEASSYEGLYSFISYINTAIEQGATVLKPAAEGKADAVRFMTVHGSKGLEFSVVFLCDTHHPFNLSDTRSPLLYDREYGPVLRFPNDRGTALTENPIRALVASRRRRTAAEEEIRLLYVALTRARERLYVTGAVTKLDEKLENAHKEAALFLDWKILSRTNCLAWILPLLSERSDPYLRLHYLSEEASAPTASGTHAADEERENGFAAPDLAEELYRRLTFTYPDEAATRLPEKLSVSRLSPTVLDGSEEEAAAPIALPEEHRPTVPVFLSGKHEGEAALAGTATHLFMQFCDLAHLSPEGVEAEIARLVEHAFLTPEDAARVRRDEVAAFCRSALFARLTAAKRLRRELRFHATLPAEAFTTEEARAAALAGRELLVQGVIDCILEEEDGYTIIDYKTDRLTPAELADKSLAAEKLTRRHADQLTYYAAACTRMFRKPPRELLLYSLPLGDTVRVDPPAIV